MIYSIALDGPGGAGKSSIAKQVAKLKGIVYVDTGAMYRAIALHMLKNNVDIHNEESVVAELVNVDIKLEYREGAQCVILNGEDVSTAIRQNEVSMAASVTSAYKQVRAFLMDTQRNVAKTTSVIMDGRDIGTVVLPKATVKIFLTASAEVRAQRRCDELIAKGQKANYQQVLKEIQQRDYQDTHREVAPLKMSRDSIKVDTSDMDIDQVVATIKEIILKKVGA